jgi:hypothetical protein
MVKAKVPTTDSAAKKWASVTSSRTSDYLAGVTNPKKDWATGAAGAAASYKAAVASANIDKKFSGGVQKAGTQKWQNKAKTLGADRFGPGVNAAQNDYQSGVDPYLAVIAGTDLPDRKPRGDPGNYARVQAIGSALFAKRVAMKTAGS